MILTDAIIRAHTHTHTHVTMISRFFREIGCFPPIVHTLNFGKFGAFGQWTAGGMSTSSWSAATPNTTASITEFSYKGVSPTEAGSFWWQKIKVRLC